MQLNKLVLAGTLMTLLGCSDAVSPGDLAISITPNRSQLRSGDTLSVAVTAINIGDRAYTITSTGCPRPFRIYDPDGQRILLDELCNAFGMMRRLEPGDSHTYQFTWVANSNTPGFYGLRGYLRAAELGDVEAGSAQIYIGH